MAGSSIGGNLERWHLSDTERAFNLEETPTSISHTESPLWKLYVPKLMPLMTKGCPKTTPVTLTDTMFINDKPCKPVVQKQIYQRNWLEAGRPANCSFAYPWKPHDMPLEVEVLNKNLENLRITNTTDNSIPG